MGEPNLPGVETVDTSLVRQLEEAVVAMGNDYRPRTRHLQENGKALYTNRLIMETSPYLVQHAHNPVNFYPWGNEAFEAARRDNKPVMLSVGYSTCHWCHVMERESFEDLNLATYLNQHYISIKVDKEERPDIDDIYMKATTLLIGRGGWPMTVILTPQGQPFFAGTYFPPYDIAGRVGFASVLKYLKKMYNEQPQKVVHSASEISNLVKQYSRPKGPSSLPEVGIFENRYRLLLSQFDKDWGGFGKAPKFPQPDNILFLFRYYHRTSEAMALQMAISTLYSMSQGGIYDQIGGGFHRYATDKEWLIPHFEKMLYDNAQLAVAYLEGYQVSGDQNFARVAKETLDYLIREMMADDGAFYSATDADSQTADRQEIEGYYFTWTLDEIEQAIGTDRTRLIARAYGVTQSGNFEGRNILHLPQTLETTARNLEIEPALLENELQVSRNILYEYRQMKQPPTRDDKILTSWNALAVSAFAKAALILSIEKYQQIAATTVSFILARLVDSNGRLMRSYIQGKVGHSAFLEDYALLIAALLDLYEASGELQWMEKAIELQAQQDELFADSIWGGYYTTSHDHEVLLSREKPSYDGAIPSGNSVAMLNLLRLADFTGSDKYRESAQKGLKIFAFELQQGIATTMLHALDYYHYGPVQIVIVKPSNNNLENPFLDKISNNYIPNRILSMIDENQMIKAESYLPPLKGKSLINNRATAYVCSYGNCRLPTTDPNEFENQICKTDR